MFYRVLQIGGGFFLAVSLSAVLLLAFFYILLTRPGREASADATLSLTGYWVPNSAKLIYSRKYYIDYSSSGRPEPATVCTVFKFSEPNFVDFMNNDFKKEGNLFHKDALPADKGCSQFRARKGPRKMAAFKVISWKRSGLAKHTVYVNEAKRTVMFEMYFYD